MTFTIYDLTPSHISLLESLQTPKAGHEIGFYSIFQTPSEIKDLLREEIIKEFGPCQPKPTLKLFGLTSRGRAWLETVRGGGLEIGAGRDHVMPGTSCPPPAAQSVEDS